MQDVRECVPAFNREGYEVVVVIGAYKWIIKFVDLFTSSK